MRTSRSIMGTVLMSTVLLVCLMLLGLGPSAFAASGRHDTDDTSRLEDTLRLKNFTFLWAFPPPVGLAHPENDGTCDAIPAALGSINPVDNGTDRVRKVTREVMADGSQVIVQDDLKTGTAVDNDNRTYHFIYTNHAVFTVSPAQSAGVSVHVQMIDSFRLLGHGLHMHVGFHWRWTYAAPAGITFTLDPLAFAPVIPFVAPTPDGGGVTNWEQLSTRGEPFNCDPL